MPEREKKPLAPGFKSAVEYVLAKAGDEGKLYRANVHRSVIARIAALAVADNDGDLKDADKDPKHRAAADERVKELTLVIAHALAQEATALEHSNFKQNRLQELGVIPKVERTATLAEVFA